MKYPKYVLYDGQIAGLSTPKTVHIKYTIYVLYDDGQLASSHPTYKLSKIWFQC